MRNIWIYILVLPFLVSCYGDSKEDIGVDGTNGIGGSTARFTIVGDFLYVVNDAELRAFDVTNEKDPVQTSITNLGWGIETIFGFQDKLFIGSQWGMQIYDIKSDGSPQYVSGYDHTTSCDPVIANEDYAYVTIRSGLGCNNWRFEANQLITLNIQNISNPFATDEYQMINPKGLTFFKGDLYVGEGDNGMKQFSLADPAHPVLLEFYENIPANDMIVVGETMIITSNDGLYQFGCVNDVLVPFSPIQ